MMSRTNTASPEGNLATRSGAGETTKKLRRLGRRNGSAMERGRYLTLTSLISNCTATFGGNGVRGSAP